MSIPLKAAVIGSPISHSLSPFIFGFIAAEEKVALTYEATEVKEAGLAAFLEGMRKDKSFIGANVTLPIKEAALRAVDLPSDGVENLGAVNVIHHRGDKLHGHNTDLIGIEKTFQTQTFSAGGKNCLLWGAGGAARAMAHVLGSKRAKLVAVYNRSDRGGELARKFQALFPDTKFVFVSDLAEVKDIEFHLNVNATPLGMTGKKSGEAFFSGIKTLKFAPGALAFDLIYTPEETDFLKVNKEKGLVTVNGLGMLIDQALATWALWMGPLKDEGRLHERLKDFLRGILKLKVDTRLIFLTGFMGVGKTTTAEELSKLIQKPVLDTDKIVEQNTQKTVAQIFAESEDEFRRHESFAVRQAHFESNSIVALGGGALMKEDNLRLINKVGGILVYLKASPEVLHQRINTQGGARPLLEGLSPEAQQQKIDDLLASRKATYEKAPVQVDTTGLDARGVAFEIISQIGRLP